MTSDKQNFKDLDQLMQELKIEYIQNLPVRILQIQTFLNEKKWTELNNEFHKLKGNGKTYGFPQISLLAESLEYLSGTSCEKNEKLLSEATELLFQMAEAFKQNRTVDLEKNQTAQKIFLLFADRKI